MSTLKSSAEDLTINADGGSSDIKFQINAVEKASINSSGLLTSTTIDATALTGNLPAIDGSSLTGNIGRKNMVINGNMQVAQRGTSASGVDTDSGATEGYRTVDRFIFGGLNSGIHTMTQDSETPVGFGSSIKIDCTTAKGSLDADSYLYIIHRIEAQDLQQLGYGTSSPQAITLSFWIRSPKTGTHYVELFHGDSSGDVKRKNSYAYTISSADTWEKQSMTFAGDTGLSAIDNDNGYGLMITWYLAVGSNQQGGTNTNDNWHNTEANRCPGQVNCADSTSNNFYITGVQLELGSVATDFEHRSYGEELALCQRYYQHIVEGNTKMVGIATWANTTQVNMLLELSPIMRVRPSVDYTTGTDYWTISGSSGSDGSYDNLLINSWSTERNIHLYSVTGTANGTAGYANYWFSHNASAKFALSAEL